MVTHAQALHAGQIAVGALALGVVRQRELFVHPVLFQQLKPPLRCEDAIAVQVDDEQRVVLRRRGQATADVEAGRHVGGVLRQ